MLAPEKSVALPGFFEEVRRRKVYRVAAAYIIAAGGIIQLASAAFPAWELPSWTLRLLIVCLLMGFPVALMLAWAFDVTAQGIRATPDAAAPRTHRRRNVLLCYRAQRPRPAASNNGKETSHSDAAGAVRFARVSLGAATTGSGCSPNGDFQRSRPAHAVRLSAAHSHLA